MLRLSLTLLPIAIQAGEAPLGCLDAASTTCTASGGGETNDCIDNALGQTGSTLHPFLCAQCTTAGVSCGVTDTPDCEGEPRLCALCQDDLRCLSVVSECPEAHESVECFDCPSSGCCVTKDRYTTKCPDLNDYGNLFFCNDVQQCVPCEDLQTGLSNIAADIDDGCSSSNPYCKVEMDPRDNTCVECETAADCTRHDAFSSFDVDCLTCTDGVCGQDADETTCEGTNSAGNSFICANDENPGHDADDGQCVPCIDDAGSAGTDAACSGDKPYCVGVGDDRQCVECEAAADCLRQDAFSSFDVDCLTCTDGVCGQDADGESCAPPSNAAGNDYFCVNNGGGNDDGQCVACVDDEETVLGVDQGCSAALSHCVNGDCVECRNDEDCEGNCGLCVSNVCVADAQACGCGTCRSTAASQEYVANHKFVCVGGQQVGCRTCQCAEADCQLQTASCTAVAGRPFACPCTDSDQCCGSAQNVAACNDGVCVACGCLNDGGTNCQLQCPQLQVGVCEYCEANPPGNNCRPKDSKQCGRFCGGSEANYPKTTAALCALHRDCEAFGLDLDLYPLRPDCP